MIRLPDAFARQFAWLLLCTGFAIGLIGYVHFVQRNEADSVVFFEEQTRDMQRVIETRLASYASVLLGLRGLHFTQSGADERAFNAYMEKLELPARFPAVASIRYWHGKGMPHSHELAYEGGLAFPGGHPGYQASITLLPDGSPQGEAVLVMPAPPAEGQADNEGMVLLLLPLLDAGHVEGLTPGGTGWLSMQMSMAQAVRDVVPEQEPAKISIAIHARQDNAASKSSAVQGRLVDIGDAVERGGWLETGALLASPLERELPISFSGAALSARFTAPRNAFSSPIGRMLPGFVLAVSALFSLLLFKLLNSLSASSRQLQRAVSERTRDLEALNAALHEEVAERGRLEQEIVKLNVEERRRFAEDLHENIGQHLTAVGFLLQSMRTEIPQDWPDGAALLARAANHVSSGIEHTRMLAWGIHPIAVGEGGLIDALARLAAESTENFQVQCRFEHDDGDVPGGIVVQHNLYRIVQQAITNAVTHGRASRIVIGLSHVAGRLRLVVSDNGTGLSSAPTSGMGLRIMRFRCSVIGCSLDIRSVPGGGTSIVIEQAGASD